MDRVRFETLLAAYGADPRRWPEAERAEAEAFAAANPDAHALLSEAQDLDTALETVRGTPPGTDLLGRRILAALPKTSSAPSRQLALAPILALAACALFGVMLGFSGAQLAPQRPSADAALSAAFDDAWSPSEGSSR